MSARGLAAVVAATLAASASDLPSAQARGGTLSGLVVEAQGGAVAGALVELRGRAGRTTRTDGDGRFAFRALAPGEFSLAASKPGFAGGRYGQLAPGGSSRLVELMAGEDFAVTLRLWRYAAIAGRVIDGDAEPVVDLPVVALRKDDAFWPARFVLAGRLARTDDRGAYRLTHLLPGAYAVAVPSAATDFSFAIAPRAASEVGTRYYPDSPTPAGAGEVRLDAGEERHGVDVTLKPAGRRTVSGRLTLPDGPGPVVSLVASAGGAASDLDAQIAEVDGAGRFVFRHVEFGTYRLRVMAFPGVGPFIRVGALEMMAIPRDPSRAVVSSPGPTFWLDEPVTVDENGPDELSLELGTGAAIRGRIEYRGSRAPPPREFRSTTLVPKPADRWNVRGLPAAAVQPDGGFETCALPPGRYQLWIPSTPGWFLEAVLVDGERSFDDRVEVGGADVTGVTLVLTDRPARLTGSVTTDRGTVVDDASVIVFPADRRLWTWADAGPPRFREVRTNRRGEYRVEGLPEGEYFVLAGPPADVAGLAWRDRRHLEQFRARANAVRVRAGEAGTLNLRVTARPSR